MMKFQRTGMMSVIEDGRKVLQNFIAPEMRMVEVRLSALERQMEENERGAERRHDEVINAIRSLLLFAVCVLAISRSAAAQPPASAIHKYDFVLVRLRDRTPISNTHLIIFTGGTVKEARSHSTHISAETDDKGVVSLQLDSNVRWVQIWHQVGASCPGTVAGNSVFNTNVLFDEGALVLDACGETLERLQPYFPNPPQPIHVPAN